MLSFALVLLTVFAYVLMWLVHNTFKQPLLHPVALGALLCLLPLLAFHLDDRSYKVVCDWLTWPLAPLTVGLAIPLYLHLPRMKSVAIPLLLAICGGTLTTMVVAVWIGGVGRLPGAIEEVLPYKSVTTAVAVMLTAGDRGLTALLVVVSCVVGGKLTEGWTDFALKGGNLI